MMRTAISPRLAIRTRLNIGHKRGGLTSQPCVTSLLWIQIQQKRPLLAEGRIGETQSSTASSTLLHSHDAAGTGFLRLGFLGGHGLVHPIIGGLEIGLAGIRIVALQISLFSV